MSRPCAMFFLRNFEMSPQKNIRVARARDRRNVAAASRALRDTMELKRMNAMELLKASARISVGKASRCEEPRVT